jgi:hypothetical protein
MQFASWLCAAAAACLLTNLLLVPVTSRVLTCVTLLCDAGEEAAGAHWEQTACEYFKRIEHQHLIVML